MVAGLTFRLSWKTKNVTEVFSRTAGARDPDSRPISRVVCERLAGIPFNVGSARYTAMTEHAETRIGDTSSEV